MGCCVHALTRALPGGVKHPLQFSVNISKTAARHTLSYIISTYVVKISDPGHLRSGHQVRSNDLTT